MKINFYLQHPLMAVKDARMKVLIKKEKLRGIGAYWFIMEQLGMQPGQRAKLEDIRPFCNQDVPFAYLKRIICEYQLFAFDEDGFFTPEELNPTPQKPAKKARKSAKSQPKNDENQQKVSKISTNPLEENFGNSLNNGNLAKNELNIKENIKDIITTATTEEKEETAVAADDILLSSETDSGEKLQVLFCMPKAGGGVCPFGTTPAMTHLTVPNDTSLQPKPRSSSPPKYVIGSV